MKLHPSKLTHDVADELGRDAEALHDALSDLLRIYQFRDRKRICCRGISVAQCNTLDALVRSGPLTLGALASELYLDKSTASRIVTKLEEKGYVTCETSPDDARALEVGLTRAGRDLHAAIQADLVEGHERLLAETEPEIRRATTVLIARLAREARARFSREDGTCC